MLSCLARWDGSQWHALGSRISNGTVYAIATSGSDVYIGGSFTNASGVSSADYIVRWDGSQWRALGSGTTFANSVRAIAISGSDVYRRRGNSGTAINPVLRVTTDLCSRQSEERECGRRDRFCSLGDG